MGSNGTHPEGVSYTPTQRRLLDVLADGMPHRREELHACLGDELSSRNNLEVHLTHLRKRLNRQGLHVVCESNGKWSRYRLVRLLASPYDGYR